MQRIIPILVYSDLEAAYNFLIRTFGLESGELAHDDDGNAVHGEVHFGTGILWLHPETDEYRLSSPRSTGPATAMMTLHVDNVDEHFARARRQGAEIVYEPIDQPYGYREYSARDTEDHLWSFMQPLD